MQVMLYTRRSIQAPNTLKINNMINLGYVLPDWHLHLILPKSFRTKRVGFACPFLASNPMWQFPAMLRCVGGGRRVDREVLPGLVGLLPAASDLMMYSARVSKTSKAFSVLISLKSYQTSFKWM